VELSERATLEDIACLLWDVKKLPLVGLPKAKPALGATAMERALRAIAPIAAAPDKDIVKSAALLLKLMVRETTNALTDEKLPIHLQLAKAWKLTDEGADLVRRALVLCADHELNVSAYAVRVVASSRASLAAALLAGLAALSGPLHGGMTERVFQLMQEPRLRRDPEKALASLFAKQGWLPGFGHRLYPDGDPRMALLEAAKPSAAWRDFAAAGEKLTGARGNLDFALGHLQEKLHLPDGAGLGLFALGRTVGWIAHALEQRAEGTLIRPRAEFKK